MAVTDAGSALTDTYRTSLRSVVSVTHVMADEAYSGVTLEDVRGTYAPVGDRVATLIEQSQRTAVQITAAYLSAYVGTEAGTSRGVPKIDSTNYVGRSFGGKDLRPTLDNVRVAILEGILRGDPDPIGQGRRALRNIIDLDVKAAARAALADLMNADPAVSEQRRNVAGTCAACMDADPGTLPAGTPLDVHPNCECVAEPVIGVPQPGDAASTAPIAADQQDTLDAYIQGGTLNNALRDGLTLGPAREREVGNLEKLIASHGEKAPEKLYRFMPGDVIDTSTLKAGDTYIDRGFASTTSDRGFALSGAGLFGGPENQVILEIRGANGLDMQRWVSPEWGREFADQKEWVLQRQASMRVVGVDTITDPAKPLTATRHEVPERTYTRIILEAK